MWPGHVRRQIGCATQPYRPHFKIVRQGEPMTACLYAPMPTSAAPTPIVVPRWAMRAATHKRVMRLLRSVRIASSKDLGRCPQNDLDVQHQAPIIYVPKVEINPSFHDINGGSFTATAMHLRPARNARLHVMPKRVISDQVGIVAIVSNGMRTRSHHGHVTL